jgi:hypothetical protein
MTLTTNSVATGRGIRLHMETAVPTYARARKPRPSVVVLGGFGTDNSTGVSAEERRHL